MKWLKSDAGDPIQVGDQVFNAMLALNLSPTKESFYKNFSAIKSYVAGAQSTPATSAPLAAVVTSQIPSVNTNLSPASSVLHTIASQFPGIVAPAQSGSAGSCATCGDNEDPGFFNDAAGPAVPLAQGPASSAALAAAQTGNVSTGVVDVTGPLVQIDGLAVALIGFAIWFVFLRK